MMTYDFMYKKNIVKSYMKSGGTIVPRFQMISWTWSSHHDARLREISTARRQLGNFLCDRWQMRPLRCRMGLLQSAYGAGPWKEFWVELRKRWIRRQFTVHTSGSVNSAAGHWPSPSNSSWVNSACLSDYVTVIPWLLRLVANDSDRAVVRCSFIQVNRDSEQHPRPHHKDAAGWQLQKRFTMKGGYKIRC